jgi:DNA-binding NarL/FixJ family response regulator
VTGLGLLPYFAAVLDGRPSPDDGKGPVTRVDLLGRYSNRTSWANRLQCLPKATSEGATDTVRARRSSATRLSSGQVAELINGYHSGQTVYELAARFKIHRATVSAHLHRHGITLRRLGLDDDGIALAVRLYEDGWSVARIGERL